MVVGSTLPPSVRRQEWGFIAGMVVTVFVISTCTLLYFTWDIGSEWGQFSEHWPFLWRAFKELVLKNSFHNWQYYWQQIVHSRLENHFILHVILPLIVSALPAYIAGRLCYFPGGRDRLRHISGPQLYYHTIAIKHAKKQLKVECHAHPELGLKLHPDITITRNRESGNIFVSGAQGTGKTVFIIPLIHQVIVRGERAFIYDEKREFTALFFNPNSCMLVAPWDSRGTAWDISADANNSTRAQLIAERLIPDSNDPLWSNGARMILVGMIEILNNTKHCWGWVELADILSLDETTLKNNLAQYYPRAERFITENSKTTQSFFAQLSGSLGWVYTLAEAWPRAYEDGFSMRKWVQQHNTNKPVIIVQADKRYKDIGAPIANALIALMTSNILAQNNSTKRELWLFLDELANLPRNESLMEWMSLGRSKGCRIVAGTQSISQLQQLYTERGADSLLNMFTIFISMRVGSAGDTANYTAKVFGERDIERPTSSAGPQNTPTINWHHETQALVKASELVQLPQASRRGAEGYLLIPGYKAIYRLRWPVPKLPSQEPEHCSATWLNYKKVSTEIKTAEIVSSRRRQIQQRRHHVINEFD